MAHIVTHKDVDKLLSLLGINQPIVGLNVRVRRNEPVSITIQYYPRIDEEANFIPIFKNYKLVEVDEEGEGS